MDSSNALQVVDDEEKAIDLDWQNIVDGIVDQITDDLPDDVIAATEYLLAGWDTHKIAKKLGVTRSTIRDWLKTYPAMAMAVRNGRQMLSKWRMKMLEQQFIEAVKQSEKILSLDLEDRAVNPKLAATVAQHARFIISLYAGQQIDINVKVDDGEGLFKAKKDALAYIAEVVAQQRQAEEPIDVPYRVISIDPDNAANRPLLDPDGNPTFGKLGVFDTTDEGTLCHVCGKRYKMLARHVTRDHHMTTKEYEMTFMFSLGDMAANGEQEGSEDERIV